MKFKLGADPEMFMSDRMGNLKASCGRIGGTKTNPQPLGIGEGFAVQEDNVAIEFNIPPSATAKEFVDNLQKAISTLSDGIKTMYDYQIVDLSAASFPLEELKTPESQVFGCDPDFNAWTASINPRPKSNDPNLRSCGGHVHVGIDDPKRVSPLRIIKAMDLFLGVPSVLMDNGELRKQLYGKAGAYRAKSYGVEYRTLSNFWIFKPRLIEWVWNNTERALAAVEAQSIDFDSEQEAILTAINNNDKDMAKALVHQYELEVVYAA